MPLTVNFFAGPGAGKSTAATGVFSNLKLAGENAELVTEFAKDCTWEGNKAALTCQPYITGTQIWRVQRAIQGGAQIVVTDSPVLLGAAYVAPLDPTALVCLQEHARYPSINFFVVRAQRYQTVGRTHTEAEAVVLDAKIECILHDHKVPFIPITSDAFGITQATLAVMDHLRDTHRKSA
jgi:hypothetical protein